MAQKNHNTSGLTDISKRDDHVELSKKGGSSKSIKKSEAQKANWIFDRLKEGTNLTDDQIHWAIERVKNSQAFAVDLITTIEEIKKDVHPMQRISLLNTANNIMKTVHGEKLRTENVNVNINTTTEEQERRLMGETLEEEGE